MDNVDNPQKTVHMESHSRIVLDVRLNPTRPTSFLCGKNRKNLFTDYPQNKPASHQIHILEIPKTAAHIWGYISSPISGTDWTSPQ